MKQVKFTDRWLYMWYDTLCDDEATELAATYSREAFDRGDVDEYVTITPELYPGQYPTREEQAALSRYALFTRWESSKCWSYDGAVDESHARTWAKVRKQQGLEYRVIDLDQCPAIPWETDDASPPLGQRG